MYTIRPAVADDKSDLASFTQSTFDWGDYITERFDSWLTDPDGHLIVVELEGRAVGVARAGLLSPSELWLQGSRVHPDHRGRRLSEDMSAELQRWGVERGAAVVRLYIEDWNLAPQHLVTTGGFRRVSRWLLGHRDIVNRDPQPTGNGGLRVPGDERLRPAPKAEAEPAFMAWSTSEIGRAARGLFVNNWSWRQLTVSDLEAAAPEGTFLESASGWVLASRSDQQLAVSWMMGNTEDTYRLVRAVLDRAIETAATKLGFLVPATEALQTALTRIGCDLEPGSIWEKSLR
ncbi:MAG: GNAT family N-acetyltransferase [Acidimicrobiia bacterium]|nr:GNAT family N-acetyltransferase [Acidimicrobiia bacterium]MDH5505393.1 GNAT family N-acetyltransferase [Acidimicrobiia bacterium]